RNAARAMLEGNPAGRLRGSRNRLSEAVICALLRDFSKHGEKAIAKVRRTQPAAYLKILALLVPREHKVEHGNPLKEMTTEQIERGIELVKELIAKRDAAANAKVVEGTAETVALLAPDVVPDGPNKVMEGADTAARARERKPRERVPSPTGG